jgi:type IV pilus assembly protein PilC
MPVFTYTARDRTGNTTSGTVEAETDQRAAARLREQGLWVTDLRSGERAGVERVGPPRTQEAPISKRIRSPVSLKDLAIFYRQMHTLLNSGVALYQSLEMVGQGGQTPNPHLRNIVQDIARRILAGSRLSDAMAHYPWLFDKMQVRMVEAGERGGLLVQIFLRLAEFLEREYEIRMDVSRKTLYPKLVVSLLIFVLPIRIPLTLQSYLSELGHILLMIVAFGVPIWLAARVLLTGRAGREAYDQVKLAFPVIGKLIRKLAAARFARSLAALYGAGVPIMTAVTMSGEASGHYVLETRSRAMGPALERGVSLAQTLEASGFFPPMFIGMVRTGETTGNLDGMLDKAADFYEEEAAHATTQLVVTMGVVLLVVVAILVAIKLIGFYTGMLGEAFKAAGSAGGE